MPSGPDQTGFQLGSYDPSLPVTIDPTFSYASYLGGSGGDYAYGVAVDGAGDALVAGRSLSLNFPGSGFGFPSSSQPTAFVTKLNATGTGIVFTDYIDSTSSVANAVAVDAAGNFYVTGQAGIGLYLHNAYQTAAGSARDLSHFFSARPPTGSRLVLLVLSEALPRAAAGSSWPERASAPTRNREGLAGVQGGGNEPPGRCTTRRNLRTDAALLPTLIPAQAQPSWRRCSPRARSAFMSTSSLGSLSSRLMSR